MFDLNVLPQWPAAEVARSLGVTLANVYVTKHRFRPRWRKRANASNRRFENYPDDGCGPARVRKRISFTFKSDSLISVERLTLQDITQE